MKDVSVRESFPAVLQSTTHTYIVVVYKNFTGTDPHLLPKPSSHAKSSHLLKSLLSDPNEICSLLAKQCIALNR